MQILQPTFTGGELSPSLYARVDLARYGTSVRTGKNFVVRAYGGLVNRSGFQFVGEAKTSLTRVRLIPFEFSTEVAYVIELGVGYARFIYRGAYVESSPGVPEEVVTPWTEDQLREVAITQSADVLYMTHPTHHPIELRRLTASSFETRDFQNKNGPFQNINSDESILVTASADLGQIQITANKDIFTANMVGALFYIEQKDLRGIRPWEANWRNVAVGDLCLSDGKTYKCTSVPSGGATWIQTGGIRPIHDEGRAYDGPQDTRTSGTDSYKVGVEWEYQHSGFGIALITGFVNAKTVNAQVTSRIPASCIGGLPGPGNTWTFSGNGATKVFSITGAVSPSYLDYTVTINGSPVQSNPYYPGGGGGGEPCVDVDAILPGNIRAGDVKVGDELELFNPVTWEPFTGTVSYSETKAAHRWRVVTSQGVALPCSDSAPIAVKSGGHKTPTELVGEYVCIRIGNEEPQWDEVVHVEDIGDGFVQHITVENADFWAGEFYDAFILHHNLKKYE